MNFSKDVLQAFADADAARGKRSEGAGYATKEMGTLQDAVAWNAAAAARNRHQFQPRHPLGRDPDVIAARAKSGMKNPFSKSSFDLTEQSILARHDPKLAMRMQELARTES